MSDTAKAMQATMSALVEMFPGCAITLLISPFNAPEGARTNYVSNANRADMLTAMKEIVARFEGRGHDAPKARQ